MKSIKIDSYEIKTSRNNLKVPVINNVHLHSVYNPAKEAQAIVSTYDERLQNNKHVLVFGLGFAYHVYEICRKLESYHGNDYQVVVIEPNEEVYRDCIANHLFPNKNIKVFSGEDLETIYSDITLAKFLITKPVMVSHPPSFNLYSDYFKSFLNYEASSLVKDVAMNITNRELKSYLYTDADAQSLDSFIQENVLSKPALTNNLDHLLLAYTHLSNGEF
ncbi:hypothetical protein [Bacteriovorax sp. Seq25_V]|uniref:hypothetical protein n=1 Tax=Bacteriovorax sp. Seq25_V TaxID=1201288 RepID=UPI000389DCF6|nr:hypothetical protein [Bacteriovorax sp. Seq25_V]EQC43521.1 hypothetical protein M900_0168 [Bacteriovorax sp. Seq25_V]